ncbi:MAG: YbfB/YjiJ family MFS transporter [Alphaproteobacteria bacterium]
MDARHPSPSSPVFSATRGREGRNGAGIATPSPWPGVAAALAASLVGIGLARFAYTPLLPVLVEAGWFEAGDAAWLGAANLAGYLAGALRARGLAATRPPATALRAMMALATLAFVACAWPLSFAWFFAWRFLAGFAGGALMVLAASTVVPRVAPARRGVAAGAVFTGVGLGIAASGTCVPLLLEFGLRETWLGLGAIAAALTAAAWFAWPADAPPIATPRARLPRVPGLSRLTVQYGLNAAGLVPHMVFLSDYVARGLERGTAAGAGIWVMFGLGAIAGALLSGLAADRFGFARAIRAGFIIQFAAVPLALAGDAGLYVSAVVVGAFVPGVVPLVLGRVHELAAPEARTTAWGRATAGFALGQAAMAAALSWLYGATGTHVWLFAAGAAALLLALLLDLVPGLRHRA